MKDFTEIIEDRINSYKNWNKYIDKYFDDVENYPIHIDTVNNADLDKEINNSIIKELNLILKLYINGE